MKSLLEVGQSVLVAPSAEDAPWRMVIDVLQDGHVTLATPDDEVLPQEWKELTALHLTSLDRFSVHDALVPVVRVGTTRVVVELPDDSTPVTRRAYARVFRPVPASGMVLDDTANHWIAFEPDVRDLGGGGCSLFADVHTPDGSTVVLSFALDDAAPIVVVGRVLPHEALPTIGRVLTRIEYLLIREADRDRILRYVLLSLAGRRHGRELQPSQGLSPL